METQELKNTDYLKQLVMIAVFCLLGLMLFSAIGSILAYIIYDIEITHPYNYTQLTGNELGALKLIQGFSAVGLFIVPPLVFAKIISFRPTELLGLTQKISVTSTGLMVVIMLAMMPFLSFSISLNKALVLPEFMQGLELWMKASEEQAQQLTTAFLNMNNFTDLLVMFTLVAIIPAIGEELLFRGVLQQLFIGWNKKPHFSIWLTAIVFSALHMQFYGFLPRMLLGVVFGYLFFWSKSLWLPILAHLFNNGLVVVLTYFYPEKYLENDLLEEQSEAMSNSWMVILSIAVTLGLMYWFKKRSELTIR